MAEVAVPTFESWFLATLPAAKRLASGFDGSGLDTEDAIAEAFARAYVRWQQVCLLPYAEAWLLRVLLNLLLDRSRRKTPRTSAEAVDATDAVVTRLAVTAALGRCRGGNARPCRCVTSPTCPRPTCRTHSACRATPSSAT